MVLKMACLNPACQNTCALAYSPCLFLVIIQDGGKTLRKENTQRSLPPPTQQTHNASLRYKTTTEMRMCYSICSVTQGYFEKNPSSPNGIRSDAPALSYRRPVGASHPTECLCFEFTSNRYVHFFVHNRSLLLTDPNDSKCFIDVLFEV